MNFKKGDIVEVIDEPLRGVVVSIGSEKVAIESEEGFIMDFSANDLIKIEHDELRQSKDLFKSYVRKDIPKKTQKKTSVNKTVLEVDLHIHKLLPTTKGMNKHDILTYQLETARKQLEFAIDKKIPKLILIHGVGDGVLKMELNTLIARYDGIQYFDAAYSKYGFGATELRISPNATRN